MPERAETADVNIKGSSSCCGGVFMLELFSELVSPPTSREYLGLCIGGDVGVVTVNLTLLKSSLFLWCTLASKYSVEYSHICCCSWSLAVDKFLRFLTFRRSQVVDLTSRCCTTALAPVWQAPNVTFLKNERKNILML